MSNSLAKKALVIAGLFAMFALTFIASAQQPGFRVTEASLTPDNPQMSGQCPMKVIFNGYITTNGPGTVRYTFTRSDGATGQTYELVFKEAGRQRVTTEWTLGDTSALPRFAGWRAVRILAPNEIESSHETGSFSITCAAQGSGEATAPVREQRPIYAPAQPCRLYGEENGPATSPSSVADGCNHDASITSVQSGFFEGISPDPPGSSPERRGQETTIAFVPQWTDATGPHGARLIMGFNGNGPTGFLNWAISTDQGRTWRQFDRTNGGPAGRAVDNPTSPFNSYRGDLSIVALPRPGMVAMVTLADKLPCTPAPGAPCPAYPDLIALLISIDGGETFSKTSIVNDQLGVGITDQPRVTVDPADGSIWVLWRGRAPLAPFYTYVRGGHIDNTGGVSWDINGAGQLVSSNPVVTTLDYQHPRIKVFTRPGALSHTVAITGPQGAPLTSFYANGRCAPGAGAIRNSFWQYPLGVFFTVSEDNGTHWTDLHSAVDMGQPFALGCVGGTGGRDATGQLIYSENRIDLARDTRNGNYLVTRARAVSDSSNTFVGQQVEVWRRSTARDARFTRVATAPWNMTNPWQFNPSIAARSDGQIAVSYYQAVGSTQTVELMVMGSRDGGNTWSAPVQLSRNSPWTTSDRSLGEYDEIVDLPESVLSPRRPDASSEFWPGAFYASWSNGVGRVFAAGFTPPPARP